MSGQDDLNQRLDELDSLLDVLEALLPSLIAHGLHIISKDPALFKEQGIRCLFRLLPLEPDDRALGLKTLSWFQHNYPKEQRPGRPGHHHPAHVTHHNPAHVISHNPFIRYHGPRIPYRSRNPFLESTRSQYLYNAHHHHPIWHRRLR